MLEFQARANSDKSLSDAISPLFQADSEEHSARVKLALCAGSDPNCQYGNVDTSRLRSGSDPSPGYKSPSEEERRKQSPSFGPDLEYRYGCGTSATGLFDCGLGWKQR